MTEINCQNCSAACCKGPESMELSAEELKFMLEAGNTFYAIAYPVDHDREKVLYPRGWRLDPSYPDDPRQSEPLFLHGQEYEPLEAGLGRYILFGTCKYLKTTEEGLEMCSVYDRRPNVCRDFEMGGYGCRLMRVTAGVDDATPEHINVNDLTDPSV
jgi:Fe-S-cluster containining protein